VRLVPETAWDLAIVSDQGASVQKILDGTLRAIATVGTRRLSMSDIIHASGVSRGTLYRYFASKEDVLAAVSEYVCNSFERGIAQAAASVDDPMERFRAVMRFYARFTIERSPEGIFEVEPAFHLEFLRTHFGRHTAAVAKALAPCIDYIERLIHAHIDREVFASTLVRLQLSTLIVPASSDWVDQWNGAPDALLNWVLQIADCSAKTRKG
jgi:AcrR family transcriptional regulator